MRSMKDYVSSDCRTLILTISQRQLLFLLSISGSPISSSLKDALFTDSVDTEKVWKVALDTGANVLALNILEAEASSDIGNSRRNSLNEKILNHQQKR